MDMTIEAVPEFGVPLVVLWLFELSKFSARGRNKYRELRNIRQRSKYRNERNEQNFHSIYVRSVLGNADNV